MAEQAKSPRRIADPEERAAALALANRRRTDFAKVWHHVGEDLVSAGERWATWYERGQPVTSAYGEVRGGQDSERRFLEYRLMKSAEAAVRHELGTRGLVCFFRAVLEGMSAKAIVEAYMVHLSRADMVGLGAITDGQRLAEIKRKYAVGLVTKALEIVRDVLDGKR